MDAELKEYLSGEFEQISGEFEQIKRRVDAVEARLSDEIHKTRVLLEDARDEVRVVAEGVVNNGERIDRLAADSQRERKDIRDELLGHLRTTHQGFDRRVTRLEDKETPSGVSFPRRPRPGRGL